MKPTLITALAVMLPTCALAAPGTRTPPAAPVEGVVVKVDGDEVVIDIGRAAGLPAGEPVPGAVTFSAKLKLTGWLMRLRAGPLTDSVVAAGLT